MWSFLLAPVLLLDIGSAAKPATTWSEIQRSIGDTICFPSRNGEVSSFPVFGFRSGCGEKGRNPTVDAAVDEAFEGSPELLVAIQGYDPPWMKSLASMPSATDLATRTANARSAMLSDSTFKHPLLRRVLAQLAERKIECSDCPRLEPVPVRTVPWKTILPYALAFVWIDPIKTVRPDGTALDMPKLSFHVCTGLNTIGEQPRDEALARVGYATARAMKHVVGDTLLEALGEPEYGTQRTDEARTAFARRRVHERLAVDPQVQTAICATADRLVPDLGVIAADCK